MKLYLRDLLVAIPLAIGLVLTMLCVANALESTDDADKLFFALASGLLGIPLLYASTAAILRRSAQNK